VRIRTAESRLDSWRGLGEETRRLRNEPLEKTLLAEPFSADDAALRLELGQTFERLLRRLGGEDLVPRFRDAYPIPRLADSALGEMRDRAAARFLATIGERGLDGLALVREARDVNAVLARAATTSDTARTAVTELRTLVAKTYGEPAAGDPETWDASRLSYDATLQGPGVTLKASPSADGSLEWFAFDRVGSGSDGPPPDSTEVNVIPANVRFRGMPNARFWDFETRVMDFGEVRVTRADLAKLVVMDFMLVQGNDWFLVPYRHSVGSLAEVRELIVRDVFGVETTVPRADAGRAVDWTLFSIDDAAHPGAPAGFAFLPGSAASAMQLGEPIEEVRFFRDEVANMVWAVEATGLNGIGEPWPGAERVPFIAPRLSETTDEPRPLHYRLQTTVPENWIPFLPTRIDENGQVALMRGAMLKMSGGTPTPVGATARLLLPTSTGTGRYLIREEELPRTGLRVTRRYYRTRWTDGSTHLWIARARAAGAGEGWSGLQSDSAV
jgi:hypothetical protein